jgi:hypothetical protein
MNPKIGVPLTLNHTGYNETRPTVQIRHNESRVRNADTTFVASVFGSGIHSGERAQCFKKLIFAWRIAIAKQPPAAQHLRDRDCVYGFIRTQVSPGIGGDRPPACKSSGKIIFRLTALTVRARV